MSSLTLDFAQILQVKEKSIGAIKIYFIIIIIFVQNVQRAKETEVSQTSQRQKGCHHSPVAK